MQAHEQMLRFSQMERAGAHLRARFKELTSAHMSLQGRALKSVSVSDSLDDGSIEALFLAVRIRFQLLMIFNDAFEPRGKVLCTHCHCNFGDAVQDNLGGFTFDIEGNTDLETCFDGRAITLREGAPQIVLMFLERAMAANRRV